MDIKKKIASLPSSCGVYLMKSAAGKIIYIGKAVNIKKRIQGHWRRGLPLTEKTADIDYVLCDREEQALILEASLIKEKRPRYNVELKDDKSYPYLVVTDQAWPRIYIARAAQLKGRAAHRFGPFTSVKLLKRALNLIRRIFPFCTCKRPKQSCLYCHLKLCPGPGLGEITQAHYRENIANICRMISGKRRELVTRLERKMRKAARAQDFEQAAAWRDKLISLYTLYAGQRQASELLILKELLHLRKIPFVIEAVDIACLAGEEASGAVVVFRDGLPHKGSYRRYKIKQIKAADDCQMMAEVVRRRYRRLQQEAGIFPDLVIVDGGPGQVNAACKQLTALGLKIPLIGIAKRNEELYFPADSRPLVLAKDSPALHLVQRARDEAHRFSHSYHLLLRKKKIKKK